MSNLFAQLGDMVLQKVAPKAAAEAVCVTTRQYRCTAGWCNSGDMRYPFTKQYRDCYDGTSCSGCNSWKFYACC